MKNKIKSSIKIIVGIIIGIVISASTVYAITAVIESKEVTYDNSTSHGGYTNVQESIDELYERAGYTKTQWTDPILHGADPVFDKDSKLIPVTIDNSGQVQYANLYTEWYNYSEKKWANAVILIDKPSQKYITGDIIKEADIESYFVWIPRYKYKIWNLGDYTTSNNIMEMKSITKSMFGNARIIEIVFENNKEKSTTEKIGNYYTHPAFTLGNTELNGIWVGKFETGYSGAGSTGAATVKSNDSTKIIIKPNVYSWRGNTVYNFFKASYNYERNLESHMMKNTEWGAVAYLSHSSYGLGGEININNNSEYKTGYSAAPNTDRSAWPSDSGNATSGKTLLYNTPTGYLASTTGNISGVYDMSGGTHEYMASYNLNSTSDNSEFPKNELTTYAKYLDAYSAVPSASYNKRILGDATGEMGPFYTFQDKDGNYTYHNTWYAEVSYFFLLGSPWLGRGGDFNGALSGQFCFFPETGGVADWVGSRLVLAVSL